MPDLFRRPPFASTSLAEWWIEAQVPGDEVRSWMRCWIATDAGAFVWFMKMFRVLWIAFGLLCTAPASATKDDLRSITGMRDHYRVLIVFTPSLADARLAAQRAIMARIGLEAAKRDLLFVQVDPMTVIGASDNPDKLRRKFVVPVLNYHAILIDKDGRTLQETPGPMEASAILHAIDLAPRRQFEMHRAHVGKPIVDKGR